MLEKKKLIGATFNYTEDQDLAIESILKGVEDQELQHLLNSNLELIKQTFNQVEYKNLRSFKQTILDFERFYKKEYFEYKGSFSSEIFEKILKAFFILSLENKIGRFKDKILKFKENSEKDGDFKTVENYLSGFIGSDANSFYRKYQLRLENYIFSENLYDDIRSLS